MLLVKASGLRNEQKIDSTLIKPFQASLRRKVVSFLDACDAALDPVYLFFEAGLATWRQSNTGSFSLFVAIVVLPAGSKKKQAKQVADSTCPGTGRVRVTE